jgi:PKD repeat protein
MGKRKSNIVLISSAIILISLTFFSCKKEEPAPLPFADFHASNSGCVSPCWVYFYDNSQNTISWKWNFGNGFHSTTQNDSMLYQEFGFYDVTLWATNVDGVVDSVTKEIMVY